MEGMLFLQGYNYYGGTIGDVLNQWAQLGAFSYVLPFLLLFALIYGILSYMSLFGDTNKAVNAIIALTISLMALQFDFVPIFFSELFPRLGVGLSIFLVIIILAGFFIDPKKPLFRWILIGIGAIIAIVVLVQASGGSGWYNGQWWYNNWPSVAFVVIIIALVGAIVGAANPNKNQSMETWPIQSTKPGG